jgi:hypothetical protein
MKTLVQDIYWGMLLGSIPEKVREQYMIEGKVELK